MKRGKSVLRMSLTLRQKCFTLVLGVVAWRASCVPRETTGLADACHECFLACAESVWLGAAVVLLRAEPRSVQQQRSPGRWRMPMQRRLAQVRLFLAIREAFVSSNARMHHAVDDAAA